ncbi:hypothetical protein FRX31_021282, partial [Thalictrum thalictroides]
MGSSPFGVGSRANQYCCSRALSDSVQGGLGVANHEIVVKENTKVNFATAVGIAQLKIGREIDLTTLPVPGKQGHFPTVKLAKADVLK